MDPFLEKLHFFLRNDCFESAPFSSKNPQVFLFSDIVPVYECA